MRAGATVEEVTAVAAVVVVVVVVAKAAAVQPSRAAEAEAALRSSVAAGEAIERAPAYANNGPDELDNHVGALTNANFMLPT